MSLEALLKLTWSLGLFCFCFCLSWWGGVQGLEVGM